MLCQTMIVFGVGSGWFAFKENKTSKKGLNVIFSLLLTKQLWSQACSRVWLKINSK